MLALPKNLCNLGYRVVSLKKRQEGMELYFRLKEGSTNN